MKAKLSALLEYAADRLRERSTIVALTSLAALAGFTAFPVEHVSTLVVAISGLLVVALRSDARL
jgi:hypothetical protein